MSAAEQPHDDPIMQMVEHGITLRSGPEAPEAPWVDTVLWAEEQGFFAPLQGVERSAVAVALMVLGLEALATQWRGQRREHTVKEGLRLLGGPRAPVSPRVAARTARAEPTVQGKPAAHLLDGYRVAINGRELTLASMTWNDWLEIRAQTRAQAQGQAAYHAQIALVAQLAHERGARDDQACGEVLSDAEAAQLLADSEDVRHKIGEDLDAHIARIVSTSPLFGH